jgi:hypothetical protein
MDYGRLTLPILFMNRVIYKDVEGAPFKINQQVKIVEAADKECDPRFIGWVGRVVNFDYTGERFPEDPLISVQIGDKVDGFWREELQPV